MMTMATRSHPARPSLLATPSPSLRLQAQPSRPEKAMVLATAAGAGTIKGGGDEGGQGNGDG
jgi:hypothetical protein